MKNQLCKPCDYRRAFRLRFKFQRNPGFTAIGVYEYSRLLHSFKRHWPVRAARSETVKPCSFLHGLMFLQLQVIGKTAGYRFTFWGIMFFRRKFQMLSTPWYYRIFRPSWDS